MTNSINDTIVDTFICLQDNYSQLMSHKLIERKDTVNKTIYNPWDPIATVSSAVEELLKLSKITGMLYTQYQALNIAYVILLSTGKLGLVIREWNHMTTV